MKAVYAGSFDPLTKGHEYIIQEAQKMFELTVLVSNNPTKTHTFSIEKRYNMIYSSINKKYNIFIDTLDSGLLVDYCNRNKIECIIRGVRGAQDLDLEMTMLNVNKDLSDISTIFIPCPAELSYISSSIVRQLLSIGSISIDKYVSPAVKGIISLND